MMIDNFDNHTGINSSGNRNLSSNIKIKHQFLKQDSSHIKTRIAFISWRRASPKVYFEAVWAGAKKGKDIHDFATLDFRVGRVDLASNPDPITDFEISLEDSSKRFSNKISVSNYALINGPMSYDTNGESNRLLKTVRIPLSTFKGVDLTNIHGVRFTFNKNKRGAIYLANLHVQKNVGFGHLEDMRLINHHARHQNKIKPLLIHPAMKKLSTHYVSEKFNQIKSIRVVQTKNTLPSSQSSVEIHLISEVSFPVTNRLAILLIGNKEFKLSRYADLKHLKELIFTLPKEEFDELSSDDEISLSHGKVWKFGLLGDLSSPPAFVENDGREA